MKKEIEKQCQRINKERGLNLSFDYCRVKLGKNKYVTYCWVFNGGGKLFYRCHKLEEMLSFLKQI